MSRAPHFDHVLDYARVTAADESLCELTRLSCSRFLDDLESGRWDFNPALPEFCIEMMEGLFCYSSGELLDGTPLRGKPLKLMPWHLFCTYAICGFMLPGTQIRRFTEAGIFCPRKTVKTSLGYYRYHLDGHLRKPCRDSGKRSRNRRICLAAY